MIVVGGLVRLAGIVDNAMLERDAAAGAAIGKAEIVKRSHPAGALDLRLGEALEPRRIGQLLGYQPDRDGILRRRRLWLLRALGAETAHRRREANRDRCRRRPREGGAGRAKTLLQPNR